MSEVVVNTAVYIFFYYIIMCDFVVYDVIKRQQEQGTATLSGLQQELISHGIVQPVAIRLKTL